MKCALFPYVSDKNATSVTALKAPVDTGAFNEIRVAPASSQNAIDAQLRDAVAFAKKENCEWIFWVDTQHEILPDAMHGIDDALTQLDAFFGVITTAGGKPGLQVMGADSSAFLILFNPKLVCDTSFFIKTSVAETLVNLPDTGKSLFRFVYTIWNRCVCRKIDKGLTITSGANFDIAAENEFIQNEFMQKQLFFGEPRVQQFYNLAFEQTLAFYHANNLGYYTDQMSPTFLKMFPYHGQCPVPTINNRVIGLTTHADDVVTASIFWRGHYEPLTTSIWQDVSASTTGLVLDIGAYTGYYALLAAMVNFENKVIGFEPVPENYARCLLNAQINNLGNLTFSPAALGDSEGLTTIEVSAGAGFLPTGAQVSDVATKKARIKHPATVTTLAHIMDNPSLPKLTLLKIDTEGFEPQVLMGGKEFIERDKPDIILEVTQQSAAMDEVAVWLQSIGYKIFVINEATMKLEKTSELKIFEGMDRLNRYITAK